ncbi:MAG: glycosyltransferase [Candidatus Nanoarchaeia archaeon]
MKKRVLIVISSLKLGGGAERVASIIGTELNNREYEVHFLTFFDRKQKYEFSGKYTSLKEKDSSNMLIQSSKLFTRARAIAKYCKKHNIDTSIGFMEEANFPLVLSRILFRNRSRIVVSQRNDPSRQRIIYKKLTQFLYNRADKVVSLSRGVENYLQKFVGVNSKKTTTIYNTVNLEKINSLKKEKLPSKYKNFFAKNDKIFITIGRLEQQKAHKYLIRAFKKLVNYNKNCKLIILGEGKLRKELQHLINSLNLQDNIYLLGNQNNVFSFIQKSDCFVFSSIYEGFGNVLLEALYLNKPVISADCNYGPREILAPQLKIDEKIKYPYYGEYGILFKPFSDKSHVEEKQLFELMKEIVENKTLKEQYSLKGLERVKNFSTQNIIKEWERVI